MKITVKLAFIRLEVLIRVEDVSTGARAWQAGAQVSGQWQSRLPTPVQSGHKGVQGGGEGKTWPLRGRRSPNTRARTWQVEGPGMWSMARPHINPCTKETWKCAGGRGGKGLAYRRQKVNHRKGGLRRRTVLSMCRGADAESGSASERMCPRSAHPGGEPTEALRDAAL